MGPLADSIVRAIARVSSASIIVIESGRNHVLAQSSIRESIECRWDGARKKLMFKISHGGRSSGARAFLTDTATAFIPLSSPAVPVLGRHARALPYARKCRVPNRDSRRTVSESAIGRERRCARFARALWYPRRALHTCAPGLAARPRESVSVCA
jgi:hypothetical protein